MGSHREKLVLGKNGSLGPKWTHLIRVTLEEEGGAEGGGWGGGFLAGGRFLHWREGGVGGGEAMSGPGGGNGFFTVTTEGPTLTSAAGISIQPWKCPFSLLTCGMNVLPTKPPNC